MHYDNETRSILLTKSDVAALVEFASDDETRPHLSCVEFALGEGEATCTATDGHTLVNVRAALPTGADRWPGTAAVCVPAKALATAAKALRKGETLAVHAASPEAVTLTAGASVATVPTLAATDPGAAFPPWRQVVPSRIRDDEAKAARLLAFNPAYLARLVLVSKACEQGKQMRAAICLGEGPLDPMRADFTDATTGAEWCAVVMPMRLP